MSNVHCPSPWSVTCPVHNRYLSCWGSFFLNTHEFYVLFCDWNVFRDSGLFVCAFFLVSQEKTSANSNVMPTSKLKCSYTWPPSVGANVIHILSRLLKCKSSTVIIMHIECFTVSIAPWSRTNLNAFAKKICFKSINGRHFLQQKKNH